MELTRETLCTDMTNLMLKNPDAITGFSAIVAEEISMLELERIYIKFMKKYRTIKITNNLNN